MPRLEDLAPCRSCGQPIWFDRETLLYIGSNDLPHTCSPRPQTTPPPTQPMWWDEVSVVTDRTTLPGRLIFTNITESAPVYEPDIPFEEEEVIPPMPTGTSESWWNANPLPSGFIWYNAPTPNPHGLEVGVIALDTRRVTPEQYADRLAELRDLLDSLGVQVAINRYQEWYTGNTRVRWPIRFRVAQTDAETFFTQYESPVWEEEFVCPLCSETHVPYTVMCPNTNRHLSCVRCYRVPTSRSFAEDVLWRENTRSSEIASIGLEGALICSLCVHDCETEGCEGWADRQSDRFCADCAEHEVCGICRTRMEHEGDGSAPWAYSEQYNAVCEGCYEVICPECGLYNPGGLTYSDHFGTAVCRGCQRRAMAGDGIEEFDASANVSARRLRIPTIPGRENIRLCGVEIEGANGTENGGHLAAAFYEAGLSTAMNRTGYHHGNGSGFAHVENDSSVDWEAVFGPINMADRNDVLQLNRGIRTIRERVRDGRLSLDLRAGCHIHVDAARVSLDGAFSLATLFAYIEDVIFRLGAAKWPIHRALQGSDYAQPIPKETRKLAFAQVNGEEGARYFALSFQNYFGRMLGGCRCGAARYDSWEDCTCDLGKCTFEFRVFNTTANPRKLHAYLALSQALVAKALQIGKIEDPANEFPAHGFIHKRFKDMAEDEQAEVIEEWQERLTWMFEELPLTDDERESLRYCVLNSELANAGEDFINDLIPAAVSEQQAEGVAA